MKQHVNIKISGRVHGVLFRFSAKEKANSLGIVGFAKNMKNGSVQIQAEGESAALNKFLDWCAVGPPLAEISKVEIEYKQLLKNFTNFESVRSENLSVDNS